MGFSQRIKTLRKKAGLSQAQLAEMLGLTNRAVGAWESGRSRPRLDKLEQIAEVLGTDSFWLLNGDENIPVRGTSAMVPLVDAGVHLTDLGVPDDTCEEVEVPKGVADRHPGSFAIHAAGPCMNRRFPEDCIMLVDPERAPRQGEAVYAEVGDMRVVRAFYRGASTLMLCPDSTGEFEDIVVGPEGEPARILGTVVWYQRDEDVR